MFGSYVWDTCQKVIIIIITICIAICMVQNEMGAHVRLTVFTAGSVWGCVYLTFSVALWHRPKMTQSKWKERSVFCFVFVGNCSTIPGINAQTNSPSVCEVREFRGLSFLNICPILLKDQQLGHQCLQPWTIRFHQIVWSKIRHQCIPRKEVLTRSFNLKKIILLYILL